jgi:glycosyltransferase involved in cell wall biosynthesis
VAVGFTVAIPTHDRRETAVLAALSALRQTRPPEQVLVLCDGCTDGTADAIRAIGDERALAVELPKGPGYAYSHRNVALELATATVVLWLGDDDLLLPDHLEQLGRYWDLGALDVVTTPAVQVEPDDALHWVGADWSVPWHRAWMERGNTNVMASVSVRAELARAVGGWSDAVDRRGDWDLWKRVLAAGARAADTAAPTVLHFRGTERVQAWSDRVAQNTRWLERISDPDQLAVVQRDLLRARAEREARIMERLERVESERDGIVNGRWWRLRGHLLPLRDAVRAVATRGR